MKLSGFWITLIVLTFSWVINSTQAYCQTPYVGGIIINEIDIENGQVELYNPTSQAIDVTNWRLCVDSTHTVIFVQPYIGSRLVQPSSYLIVEWNQINTQMHELALYIPYGQLANPINMEDYIQIGGIGQPNVAHIAVEAGVWDNVDRFVPYPESGMTLSQFNNMASNGNDTNSNHWVQGLDSMGEDNGCIPGYFSAIGNNLIGLVASDMDYVTNGIIESSQLISGPVHVSYSAAIEVNLLSGFEIALGAELDILIEGCN